MRMDGTDIETTLSFFQELSDKITPYLDWASQNWLALVLTGEIVGAVVAIKVGRYRRGFCWLCAALATIWIGGAK